MLRFSVLRPQVQTPDSAMSVQLPVLEVDGTHSPIVHLGRVDLDGTIVHDSPDERHDYNSASNVAKTQVERLNNARRVTQQARRAAMN